MMTMATKKEVIDLKKTIGQGYNAFWNSRDFYRVVKGSRGSKKSKTTALNFITRIMENPWANLLVVRRFSNTLKQSTYTDLKWAIRKLKVSHLWKTNESLPELTYIPTGQKILFRGLDDPLKITSITVENGILCWCWFEEAFEIESEDKFSTVVESIRGSYEAEDFFKQITVTFNPWSEKHWLKAVFFDPKTSRKGTFARTTTFRCNEWLDKQDKDRMEDLYKTNPRRAKIVCDGEWGIADGLVYDNFEVAEFDEKELIKKGYKSITGLDFGYKADPTAMINGLVNEEEKLLYICDEHYQKGMLNSEIADMLKYKGVAKQTIIADSAEPKSIEDIKRRGVPRIKGAKKGKDSIINGVTNIQEYKIIIHPRCINFIIEINNYIWDKNNSTGKTLNKPVDDYNHLMDALRYAMEMLRRKDRMKPIDKINSLKKLGF
ncbi:MAG: PBSX family phage terminase large subunit [Carnobacterium sp.]|uniref:PBSX family phage terminase large subunit n=1 Tax=Carnobacterium sp. TaxID=48221 RepID=UPI003A9EF176